MFSGKTAAIWVGSVGLITGVVTAGAATQPRSSAPTAAPNWSRLGSSWFTPGWFNHYQDVFPVRTAVPSTTVPPPDPATTVATTDPSTTVPTTDPATTVPPTTVPLSGINTVAKVESDMEDANVVFPDGVPSDYSWYGGPGIEAGNNVPTGYSAITMWGQLYPKAGGSPQPNVDVEFQDPQTWIYSISHQAWNEVQGAPDVQGNYYLATFAGNTSTPATIVAEPDGGYAVTPPTDGYNFHFWPSGGRGTIDASDVGGVFTTVQARLVAADPSQPADLSADQYVLDVGGDYWQSTGAPYPDNAAIFESRFDAVTSGWQSFDAITWSQARISANPALPLNRG